jgi:hypothetical protein
MMSTSTNDSNPIDLPASQYFEQMRKKNKRLVSFEKTVRKLQLYGAPIYRLFITTEAEKLHLEITSIILHQKQVPVVDLREMVLAAIKKAPRHDWLGRNLNLHDLRHLVDWNESIARAISIDIDHKATADPQLFEECATERLLRNDFDPRNLWLIVQSNPAYRGIMASKHATVRMLISAIKAYPNLLNASHASETHKWGSEAWNRDMFDTLCESRSNAYESLLWIMWMHNKRAVRASLLKYNTDGEDGYVTELGYESVLERMSKRYTISQVDPYIERGIININDIASAIDNDIDADLLMHMKTGFAF